MLVSFTVSNYRSFGEEVTLNMVASNKLVDHPDHRVPIPNTSKFLLRAAVIYGANAAGKSNLVRAMRFAQDVILERHDWRGRMDRFRFSSSALQRLSTFEFRILVRNRVFIYGFDLSDEQIESEWLAVLKGEDEVDIFQRDGLGNTTIAGGLEKLFDDDQILFKTLRTGASITVMRQSWRTLLISVVTDGVRIRDVLTL